MDEDMEAEIYETLMKKLPATTIVSIGHRASLAQIHNRRLEMVASAPGVFTPAEVAFKPAE
jgi:putative ATP-binding cassette transporter